MILQKLMLSIEKTHITRQGNTISLFYIFCRKGVIHNFGYCLFLGFHEIHQIKDSNPDEFIRISC